MFPLFAVLTALAPAHAAPPDLGGSWALALRMVSAAQLPVLGAVESTTVSYGLLRELPSVDGPAQRYEVCRVELEGRGALVRSTIPAAFIAALPVRTIRPELRPDGASWALDLDLGDMHLGFEPTVSGGLPPRVADHAAVLDSDGDGSPGATVLVDVPLFPTVQVWITQATSLALHGSMEDPDTIRGVAELSYLEQHVVGASHRLFARSPTIAPVEDASSFLMLRIPDDAGCDRVPALVRSSNHAAAPGLASVVP